MKPFSRSPMFLAVALLGGAAFAQEDTRPLATRWAVDYAGFAEIGVGYVSDENFEFGEYNGLNEDEAFLIGNIDWSGGEGGALWNLRGNNLGLDTREGGGRWRNSRWDILFEYDSQQQVRNNTGRTPFRGGDTLLLPADWVSGVTTADFDALGGSLRGFDQELERDRYTLSVKGNLNSAWSIEGKLFYEEKEGDRDLGAAIFSDAAAGDAVILPRPVDYENTEFDLAVNYAEGPIAVTGTLFYSEFDNGDDLLQWQNPYGNFGPDVSYPEGFGGMSLEPDNEYSRARLLATWVVSPALRLQLDGSYGKTEQDQSFLAYTVNPNLTVTEPLPEQNLDGELETSVLDARVFWSPLRKLRLEGYFHGEERDYDVLRAGWQYVLGDASDQVDPAGRLYNTAHDYHVDTWGIEGSFSLPRRSKLWLTYEYEEIERDNAAVMKSEEDRYRARYRLPILSNLSMRLEALHGDRVADIYEWDQSYYARLDAERINATPDNQRYLNHPLLSQYHVATREQVETKLDLDWQPTVNWNLALNLLYRENDYDETELGLSDEEFNSASLTASWVATESLVLTAWTGYNEYESQQGGRAFRGGIEKNAFELVPPLPQASDPSRNWDVEVEDEVITIGLGVEWQLSDRLSLSADYSYMDTDSDYDFANRGGAGLSDEPLPSDFENEMHHLVLGGAWHYRENLTIGINYQYWKYESEDWAINGLGPDSLAKVMTLGEQPADEDLHYIGTSIIYRWQ